MNIRQIEVFRALMLNGTVSAAAQFLSVSQPGVSRLRNLGIPEGNGKCADWRRATGRGSPTFRMSLTLNSGMLARGGDGLGPVTAKA
jgi:hypothetical protein